MRDKLLFTTTLLIALGAVACGNDNGGNVIDSGTGVADGGPDGGCAVEPNFTSLQTKLFGAVSCNRGGCHDAITVSGSLDMSGAKDAVHAAIVNAATAEPGTGVPTRITPNNPQMSSMYRKMADADPPGTGGRMPLGCDFATPPQCLPQCQLDAVQEWINNGAPND